VNTISEKADELISKGHFNGPAIEAKKEKLVKRYNNLSVPVSQRKQMLEDARNYQQFLHDVEDEESWIREKEPIASSLHTGRSPWFPVFLC